jgi:hypothetical protein
MAKRQWQNHAKTLLAILRRAGLGLSALTGAFEHCPGPSHRRPTEVEPSRSRRWCLRGRGWLESLSHKVSDTEAGLSGALGTGMPTRTKQTTSPVLLADFGDP